ncbi:MAG: SDR family oxidoreductase [Trueperaceae bacterium]
MARFDGSIALVTGGARGIGAAIARGLVAEGGRVVVADVLEDEGRALAAELGEAATFVRLDVTSEDGWTEALRETEAFAGPIDLLVNNAGVVGFGPIDAMDTDEFRRVLDINVTGVFLGMKHAIPSLRRAGRGTIVNVSSTAGMMGYANLVAYVGSKWAVRGMTKTAGLELGRDGIRAMSVHPGPIRTPMTEGMGDELAATQPIPRFGEPDEVAKLVLFLAADATFSTGSEFVVDGGALLGPLTPIEPGS